jgi:hypothetical protein
MHNGKHTLAITSFDGECIGGCKNKTPRKGRPVYITGGPEDMSQQTV